MRSGSICAEDPKSVLFFSMPCELGIFQKDEKIEGLKRKEGMEKDMQAGNQHLFSVSCVMLIVRGIFVFWTVLVSNGCCNELPQV